MSSAVKPTVAEVKERVSRALRAKKAQPTWAIVPMPGYGNRNGAVLVGGTPGNFTLMLLRTSTPMETLQDVDQQFAEGAHDHHVSEPIETLEEALAMAERLAHERLSSPCIWTFGCGLSLFHPGGWHVVATTLPSQSAWRLHIVLFGDKKPGDSLPEHQHIHLPPVADWREAMRVGMAWSPSGGLQPCACGPLAVPNTHDSGTSESGLAGTDERRSFEAPGEGFSEQGVRHANGG